jgi:small subunit ribosomal protein S18
MTEKDQKETKPKPSGQYQKSKEARPRFRKYERRRKACRLCVEKIDKVDYKNAQLLKTFTTDSGKILSRRITGTCAKHQRQITRAIKRCRNLAMLPYTTRIK